MIKYICDRCDKELESLNHYQYITVPASRGDVMFGLCYPCIDKVLKWLQIKET